MQFLRTNSSDGRVVKNEETEKEFNNRILHVKKDLNNELFFMSEYLPTENLKCE